MLNLDKVSEIITHFEKTSAGLLAFRYPHSHLQSNFSFSLVSIKLSHLPTYFLNVKSVFCLIVLKLAKLMLID
jgi:hypothetical protein